MVAIAKRDGTIVVEYAYDAWGKILSCTGSMADTLGKKNPFRYRGYVYDEETGLYYLNSRYYDPKVGRFISKDLDSVLQNYISDLSNKNFFVYCDNNPVIRRDTCGYAFETVLDVISLSASVVDVCENPDDPWAWAGLIGDALDLVPFVAGLGETVRAAKTLKNVSRTFDVVDDTKKTIKAIDSSKPLHRPYIRKHVRQAVEARTPRASDGRFIDVNTGKPINGQYHLGHIPGHELHRERALATARGWTQSQFNDYMNNPYFYRIEEPHNNMGHAYEAKRWL